MHLLSLLLLGLLWTPICAQSAGAVDSYKQIKGKDLRTVFSGTLMVGEYRDYRAETKTFRYTELHREDGTTDYQEGKTLTMPGTWKVIGGDKLCYKYPKSEMPNYTHCFFVFQSEKCYYKYALPQMTLRGPRDWDIWSSRAIRKGSGGSCAAPTS